MKEMNQKSAQRWEKIREKGKKRYIALYGVLLWGLSTSVLFILISKLIFDQSYYQSPTKVGLVVLCFCIGGYIWAHFMWNTIEKKFQTDQKNNKL